MRRNIPLCVPEDEQETVCIANAAMVPIIQNHPTRDFLVYYDLVAHRSLGEGYIEISASKIGQAIGYSDSAVYESLKRLEEGGFITVEHNPGSPNRYIFRPEDVVVMDEGLCSV